MSETTPAKPRASASSTSAATAAKKPTPPEDPYVGTVLYPGVSSVSRDGVEYDVDEETGTVTGRRA